MLYRFYSWIKQLRNWLEPLTFPPALPQERFLAFRVMDPRSLLHPQHSFCLVVYIVCRINGSNPRCIAEFHVTKITSADPMSDLGRYGEIYIATRSGQSRCWKADAQQTCNSRRIYRRRRHINRVTRTMRFIPQRILRRLTNPNPEKPSIIYFTRHSFRLLKTVGSSRSSRFAFCF